MTIRVYQVFSVILLALLALNSAGCSPATLSPEAPPGDQPTAVAQPTDAQPTDAPSEPASPGQFGLAAADVPRQPPQNVDQDLLAAQVDGNNAFAFDLYRSLRSEEGNLFYSPTSISIALAMLYAGARGETEAQMAATLHYVLPQDQLHPAFNLLDQSLAESASGETDFQLNIANSLWGQEQFPFLPDFLNLIAQYYGAGVRLVDFTGNANREAARQTINDWVSDQTHQTIQDLLPEDALSASSRLVLVNAIYFKGDWQTPFSPDTKDAPFTLLDGQQISVPTMSRRAGTPYFMGQGFQALALPYQGGRAEMIIIMPDPGTFTAFEQNLDQDMLARILSSLAQEDIKLFLPKFQFAYSLGLNDSLAGMGMPLVFDPLQADFSGIYDQNSQPNNLFVSSIVHKAFVAVDEIGTEASAATGIVVEVVSMPAMVRIDRPFIFMIRDTQTGSLLFLGRVLDPTAP